MAEIVISEFMDQAAVDDLAADYDVLYDRTLFGQPAELAAALNEARALIVRNRTEVRGPVLDAAERLQAIGRLGVGLDNIDLETCAQRGIEVLPARGANDVSVAEYVIAVALILLRGVFFATAEMLRGDWPRERLIGREIAGKHMALIGYGSIARVVATKARALEMIVSAYDPHLPADDPAWADVARATDLAQLLATADIVSLHLPLLPETSGLIDRRTLAAMQPGAILINAARGGVVDETALCDALRANRLGGAALDVFEHEPLGADAAAKFADLPNLILTPHIAGPTAESNVRVSAVTATNVRRALEGG